jgi:cell division protein FtsB
MKNHKTTTLSSEQRIKELEHKLAQAHADLADAHAEIDSLHDGDYVVCCFHFIICNFLIFKLFFI